MVQFQHSYSLFTTSHLNNIYFSYISTYLFVLLSISGPVCVNNSSSDSYYTTYSTAQALYATFSVKNTQSRFPKRILSWVNFAVDESRLKLSLTVVVLKGDHVSCHGCTDKEKETFILIPDQCHKGQIFWPCVNTALFLRLLMSDSKTFEIWLHLNADFRLRL